jgi:hypothetical protein
VRIRFTRVENLFSFNPAARIVWAHAGMNTPPEIIDRWLAQVGREKKGINRQGRQRRKGRSRVGRYD